MIVGALFDVGVLSGAGSVKADVHTRRVLGRLASGVSDLDADSAGRVAATLVDGPPWLLDAALFRLGRTACRPQRPECGRCALKALCAFSRRSTGRQVSSVGLLIRSIEPRPLAGG